MKTTTARSKTLAQIFRIAQQFHIHHNGEDLNYRRSAFMCHAIVEARSKHLINDTEKRQALNYTESLVKAINPACCSLAGALYQYTQSDLKGRRMAAQIWEGMITAMEQEEEQPMIKIRHYRNIDVISFNYATLAMETKNNNMGGATIAFQELGDGTVKLGLSVCVENFSRKTGIDYAKRRLIAMPIIVEADELSDIHTLQDLLFSDLGDKLEALYREKGVHIDLFKAALASNKHQ